MESLIPSDHGVSVMAVQRLHFPRKMHFPVWVSGATASSCSARDVGDNVIPAGAARDDDAAAIAARPGRGCRRRRWKRTRWYE